VHVLESVILGYTADGRAQHRAFSLQCDLDALSRTLAKLTDVAVVVIDPITAYLGDVDSHRNAEVRALLAPLSDLAAKHNVAIIGVSHLSKSGGADALMRVTGSLAFVAAARAAYLVAEDPDDKARRLFLPMKNNIGPDSTGMAFSIEAVTVESAAGPIQSSRVVWESDPVTVTADEVIQARSPEPQSALREAEDWLRETLTEPKRAVEVFDMAKGAGVAERTLRRAAVSLSVTKDKLGMEGGWMWSLPSKRAKMSEDVQQNSLDSFGKVGHLRESEEAMEVEL
jgi:hypothetical protein